MQRLNSAFRFIDLSFRLAQSHETIQKPWMILTLGGVGLTLLWLPSLAVLILFWGSRPFAWILVGLILLLYALSLAAWGEITALQTAQIFASLFCENEEQEASSAVNGIFQSPWMAALLYGLSRPSLILWLGLQRVFTGKPQPESEWLKAHPLVPVVLAVEGQNLKGAVKRVRQIFVKNLLRFRPGYLPVSLITCGAAWISFLVGAAAGGLIARRIANPNFAATWMAFIAVGVAMGVMGVFTLGGIAFSTYFRTCYHTALYIWGLNVERANEGAPASPPEILSQAMTKEPKERKEGSE